MNSEALLRLARREAILGGHDTRWMLNRHRELLAEWSQSQAPVYRDELDYLYDDHPAQPFEPGDYLTDRRW